MAETVTDGAFCEAEYKNAPVKILWLLKEPLYDKMESQIDFLRDALENKRLGSTWTNMAYVAHSVVNGWESGNFEKWEDVPSVEKGVGTSLYSVAMVNVKKTANQKPDGYSDNCEICNAYHRHADEIVLQVKKLNPDIIVFGYPEMLKGIVQDIFRKITGDEYKIDKQFGTFAVTVKRKRLFIWAYHPGYYRSEEKGDHSQHAYYDSFVESVKLFKQRMDEL